MILRLLSIALFITYQVATMPCRDCPLPLFGMGPATYMACCEQPDEPPDDCCGQCCDEEGAAPPCPVQSQSPKGCACCPMPMPCDRCLPVVSEKPVPPRMPGELIAAVFIGHVNPAGDGPVFLFEPIVRGPPHHQHSLQAEQCCWLN